MIKKIIYTIFSKVGIAALNFALLMLSANYLGPTMRGEASLMIVTVNVLAMIVGFIGGPSLMNICKNIDIKSYLQKFIITSSLILLLICLGLYMSNSAIFSNLIHIYILSLLLSLLQVYQYILIGNNQIKDYNLSQLLQALFPLIMVGFGFYIFPNYGMEFQFFLSGIYLSFAIPLMAAIYTVHTAKSETFEYEEPEKNKMSLVDIIKTGMVSQFSNLLQFFNYRLVFYFISYKFTDHASLGEFSLAIALAESVWIIGRSIGVVQTGEFLQNENSSLDALKKQALTLSKNTILLAIPALFILISIPQEYIQLLVGKKYIHTHELLMWLAPGTLIFSFQFSLSSFFAAIFEYKYANMASVVSLASIIIAFILLRNDQVLTHTTIPSSIGYTVSTLFFYWSFTKYTKKA